MSRLPTSSPDTTPLEDEVPVFAILDLEKPRPGAVLHVNNLTKSTEPADESVTDIALDFFGTEEVSPQPITAATDNSAITRETFLAAQKDDADCKKFDDLASKPDSRFHKDDGDFTCYKSPQTGRLLKVVPKTLRQRVLYLAHDPPLQGHPGLSKMYATLCSQFYWPGMYGAVEAYVRQCRSCAKAQGTIRKSQTLTKLFPPSGPLRDIAMDLISPLPKTKTGATAILVITDRYGKLCRAIPLKKTDSTTVAASMLNNWFYPYGLPDTLLTDNGSQFISAFFEYVCSVLGIKRIGTTAYHPKTNGQTERYNKTLEKRLRIYADDHLADWDTFVQKVTYGYNCQVHKSTGVTPFTLALTRHPPSGILDTKRGVKHDHLAGLKTTKEIRLALLKRLSLFFDQADERGRLARQAYKDYADRGRKGQTVFQYKPGDFVFVNRPRIDSRTPEEREDDVGHSKLSTKAYGRFKVVHCFEHHLVVLIDGVGTPVNLDRIRRAPDMRESPRNPSDPQTPPAVRSERMVTDGTDTHEEDPDNPIVRSTNSDDIQVRIHDHSGHRGHRKYTVQMDNGEIREKQDEADINKSLLADYWQEIALPKKNPENARRGRARQGRGGR